MGNKTAPQDFDYLTYYLIYLYLTRRLAITAVRVSLLPSLTTSFAHFLLSCLLVGFVVVHLIVSLSFVWKDKWRVSSIPCSWHSHPLFPLFFHPQKLSSRIWLAQLSLYTVWPLTCAFTNAYLSPSVFASILNYNNAENKRHTGFFLSNPL